MSVISVAYITWRILLWKSPDTSDGIWLRCVYPTQAEGWDDKETVFCTLFPLRPLAVNWFLSGVFIMRPQVMIPVPSPVKAEVTACKCRFAHGVLLHCEVHSSYECPSLMNQPWLLVPSDDRKKRKRPKSNIKAQFAHMAAINVSFYIDRKRNIMTQYNKNTTA